MTRLTRQERISALLRGAVGGLVTALAIIGVSVLAVWIVAR